MISQEQLNQIQQDQPKKHDIKYIHLQKKNLLTDFAGNVTIDGLTFNGKNYLKFDLEMYEGNNPEYTHHRLKFDGITVSYAEDQNGNLAISFAVKSPKDEYKKKVGRNFSGVNLIKYLESDPSYNWTVFAPYGFLTFVKTIDLSALNIPQDYFHVPAMYGQKTSVSYLKNRFIVKFILFELGNFLIQNIDFTNTPSVMEIRRN